MKRNKEEGPDKNANNFTKVINEILNSDEIATDLSRSVFIALLKKPGVNKCKLHRTILSHKKTNEQDSNKLERVAELNRKQKTVTFFFQNAKTRNANRDTEKDISLFFKDLHKGI